MGPPMGRLTCLILILCVGSPALARQDAGARASNVPNVIRISTAFGVITSTLRSPAHNRAVGGVPNSYHLRGRAIDIARRPGVTHRQIDAALRSAGYNLIESLDEGDHSHFAFGPPKAQSGAVLQEVRYAPPPEPTKPAPPPVLADDHGTLIVDLATTPTLAVGSN